MIKNVYVIFCEFCNKYVDDNEYLRCELCKKIYCHRHYYYFTDGEFLCGECYETRF